MKNKLRVLAALSLVALAAAGARAIDTEIVPAGGIDEVRIADVRSAGEVVSGTIENRSDARITNLELMVSDTFRWKNERHPGDDDPSRGTKAVVPGPIPPRGSLTFRIERPAPPERRDGTFVTDVKVLGLTKFDPPAAASRLE